MTINDIADLISVLGFPMVSAIGLGIFIWKYGQKLIEDNAKLRSEIIQNNKEREDKLYNELSKAQEINKKAIETLAKYADRLDNIEEDVGDIKNTLAISASQKK